MSKTKRKARKASAKAINKRLLQILIDKRKERNPKFTRESLAEEFELHPATAMRLEKGTFGLTTERFFEWCAILEQDPIAILKQAREG